jgi:hypothetical protein
MHFGTRYRTDSVLLCKSFHPDSEASNAVFYISVVKSLLIFGMIINTLELLKKINVFLVRKTSKKAFLRMFTCMRNLIQLLS